MAFCQVRSGDPRGGVSAYTPNNIFEKGPPMMRTLFCGAIYTAALSTILGMPHLGRADDAKGKRFALLVGVSRFENKAALKQPDLDCPDRDADALAKVLLANGYSAQTLRLMTTDVKPGRLLYPSAANIRAQLKDLVETAENADSVLVYYGGYERQFAGTKDYFMCAADADPGKRTTLVALSEVYQELARCKARAKLVMIDSCRFQEKAAGGLPPAPDGVATFFSCSAGEFALEDAKDLKHGFFSYFVAQGLRGEADADKDRTVTLAELEQYIRRKVPAYARDKQNAKQNPELLGKTSSELPLVRLSGR